MNDDKKSPLAVPETTYLPPQRPATETKGGEQPAETRARSADSTVRPAPIPVLPSSSLLDESQVDTIDLPKSGTPAVADSVTLPTIDQTSAGQAVAVRAPTAAVGRQIGDYDILGELGRGGMGVVYKARHRQLGRVVALKMIRAGAHADADDLNRFLSEAQAVARLQHMGIVQIFDIGQHDGLPYFSLEFVAGQSLLARIAKEPLEPRQAAQIVEKLARAMQYAHDQGILHRDLKPANVLLTPNDEPKITDFGLAKHIQEGASASTQTGSIMGTPSYMSPEQASGNNKELTPATDQYALGAVLYHLLTGRPPFLAAKAVETVLQVLHNDPVAPRQLAPKLPVDLETICLKALHKDSHRRYASCGELAADLRRFLGGEPIIARPVGQIERAWRWCRRNPRIAIPTAASILLFLIAFGITVGSAWALASLNEDLKTQTKHAQTQERIATEKAKEATDAQVEEKAARELADQRTEVTLSTVKRVVSTLKSNVRTAPGLRPFMAKIAQDAVKDLEKIPHVTSRSNITERATTLAFHELMYQLYREVGETEKAWEHVREAHEIARQRVEDQQGSLASKHNLALICADMARIRQEFQRDMQVSLKFAMEGAQLCESNLQDGGPAAEAPKRWQISLLLSDLYSLIGAIHVRSGNPPQALEFFEKSQDARRPIFEDAEFLKLSQADRQFVEADLRESSATSHLAVGDMRFRLGDSEAAKVNYAKALAYREEMYQKFPNISLVKQQLAAYCSQTAYLYLILGEPDKSRPLYERAVKLASELAAANPTAVEYQRTLALAHYRFGVLKQSQGDATAKENFDACLKIRTELAKDAANVSRQRELLVILARSGQHEQATELAGKLLAGGMPDIELLLDVARAYAQCSSVVASDAAAADAYAAKAMGAISQAVKAGHKDPVYLATEPDFALLKGRDDFQALLTQERQAAAGR